MELTIGIAISAASFLTCLLMTSIIGKSKRFSFINTRENRFGNIDGVRGFLALSVFFHHYVITYYWKLQGDWKHPPEHLFENFGKVGVAIFFMITGFLFVSRIFDNTRPVNWLTLYKSRIFRIVPLYLFALLVISLIVFSNSNFEVKVNLERLLIDYLRWFSFIGGTINDFSDTKKIIAGVDWTLKYEWLFYMSLPFLFFIHKNFRKIGHLLLCAICLLGFYESIEFFSFSSKFFIYFCIGAIVSHLASKCREVINHNSSIASLVSLTLVLFLILYPNTLDSFHVLAMSVFFLLVAAGNNMFGVFSMRSSIILGEISYSIYLLHGIVLYLLLSQWPVITIREYKIEDYLLFMPIFSIIVVLLSTMTFLIIEKPAIAFGKKGDFSWPVLALYKRVRNR